MPAAAILFWFNKDIRIYKYAIITEKISQCKIETENCLKKSLIKKED